MLVPLSQYGSVFHLRGRVSNDELRYEDRVGVGNGLSRKLGVD
jgi:hypothetical protein